MTPLVPLFQVGELCQTAGTDVRRRPTGLVKVYHTLRLCERIEPLGAPFAVAVGSLVTDFDSHLSFAVDLLSVADQRQSMKGRQTVITAAQPSTRMGETKQAGSSRVPAIPPVITAMVWRSIGVPLVDLLIVAGWGP